MMAPFLGCSGSSPRVRSGPFHVVQFLPPDGITSACAEQTIRRRSFAGEKGDHLRVCGADFFAEAMKALLLGSPPRVRSRQLYFTVF